MFFDNRREVIPLRGERQDFRIRAPDGGDPAAHGSVPYQETGETMESMPRQMKSFLRPSEAAARFHVPLRTIYTWCLLGRIKCINVKGRCLRIHSGSLSEFLGARESAGRRARHFV